MNIIKRAAAIVLSGAIMTTAFTSCNLFKKLSMSEMMSTMSEIKSGAVKFSGNFEDEESKIDFSFDGAFNNRNVSFGNLTFNSTGEQDQDINLNCNDYLKYVDKNLYLNIESLIKSINSVSPLSASSATLVDSLGVKWVKVPMDVELNDEAEKQSAELNNTLINSFTDILKSSETEIVEQDNGYTVTIKDNKKFAKIAEELAKKLKSEKDSYLSQYKSAIKAVDYNKVLESSTDALIEAIKSLCDKLEIKYTDEDLTLIKEQINNTISTEGFNLSDEEWSEFEDGYDDMVKGIEDAQKEISDSKDEVTVTYTVSLEGKEGSRVGKQTITIDGKDEDGKKISGKVNFEINEEEKSIDAPKDAKTLGECAGNLVDYMVKNGTIPEDQLEMFKGINLSDLLDEFESGYNGYGDKNYDYDYDDYQDTNDIDLDEFNDSADVA